MTTKRMPLIFALLLALGVTACSDSDASKAEPTTADDDIQTVVIEPVGNEMKFATTEFTVEAGQQVKLVFENTATSPAMQHNVVFVDDRSAIDRVGQAAMTASDTEYIPDDDAIFAYTSLAQPGETVEVTFTAPDTPGDYPYICTFPGHYSMMQGTMTVK